MTVLESKTPLFLLSGFIYTPTYHYKKPENLTRKESETVEKSKDNEWFWLEKDD